MSSQQVANIHSIESFGTLDGPGIRFVVFFQGCLMRCLYCHNRDTWDIESWTKTTVKELMDSVLSYRHFISASEGGVTASGGEPTLQAQFICNWFTACKEEQLHTCLDTNGFIRKYNSIIDELLAVTDLVMLDLKQINNSIHQKLIGVSNKHTLEFAEYLTKKNKRTWIRYVIVPGWTDDETSARLLGKFTQSMDNIEKIELLPYHTLGKHKWQSLGLTYQLGDISAPSYDTMEMIKKTLLEYGHQVTY